MGGCARAEGKGFQRFRSAGGGVWDFAAGRVGEAVEEGRVRVGAERRVRWSRRWTGWTGWVCEGWNGGSREGIG